jgi:hypothetical protein
MSARAQDATVPLATAQGGHDKLDLRKNSPEGINQQDRRAKSFLFRASPEMAMDFNSKKFNFTPCT